MVKHLLPLLALLSLACLGQISYQITATTTANLTGQGTVVVPIAGAQSYVCTGVYDGTDACTSVDAITVYKDSGLTTPWPNNIVVSDIQGNALFWVGAGGNYYYTVTGTGAEPASYQISLPSTTTGSFNDIHFAQSLSGGVNNNFFANPFYQLMTKAPTPAVPTVEVTGSTGFTWGYEVVEFTGPNAATVASGEAFASAAATLNASNFVTINAACESNNDTIQFYRVHSGGTPVSVGIIGTAACASNSVASLNDTGLNGDGSSTTGLINTTGVVGANVFYAGSGVETISGRPQFFGSGNFIFPHGGSIFSDQLGSGSLSRLGFNFNGNVITVASLNHDGSISGNQMLYLVNPAGPVFPLGLGLGGSTTSSSSLGSFVYAQTNGTNVNAALFSTASQGSSFPDNTPGPIIAAFVAPGAQTKQNLIIPITNGTVFSCNDSASACNTPGLYEVNLYVVDSASCTVPGAAAVNFTINYTDTVGAKVAAVPLQTNAGTTAIDLALGTGVNFGSGEFIFWSQGTTSIFLNETTTNCSTGTAAGTVMAEVRRLN